MQCCPMPRNPCRCTKTGQLRCCKTNIVLDPLSSKSSFCKKRSMHFLLTGIWGFRAVVICQNHTGLHWDLFGLQIPIDECFIFIQHFLNMRRDEDGSLHYLVQLPYLEMFLSNHACEFKSLSIWFEKMSQHFLGCWGMHHVINEQSMHYVIGSSPLHKHCFLIVDR